jgi:hypothetical protein
VRGFPPLEKQVDHLDIRFLFACHLLEPCSCPGFDRKLQELRALPLMHGIWATRTAMTATQLKQALRNATAEADRILVVEMAGDWASRRAENNLGELIPPPGGPALFLWEQRWGKR